MDICCPTGQTGYTDSVGTPVCCASGARGVCELHGYAHAMAIGLLRTAVPAEHGCVRMPEGGAQHRGSVPCTRVPASDNLPLVTCGKLGPSRGVGGSPA